MIYIYNIKKGLYNLNFIFYNTKFYEETIEVVDNVNRDPFIINTCSFLIIKL